MHVAWDGFCHTAGSFAGQGLQGPSVGKGMAEPCFHPVDKGSSMDFAVLQLPVVCCFGQYFPKLKWPGQAKKVQ